MDYCRAVETYLCQKNDGHLIRIVGPAFELVSRWDAQGIPLKVTQRGIDRYFERYYRKGPRRRPIRIEFCEADVLDCFDEWRRALGLTASTAPSSGSNADVEGDAAGDDKNADARRGPSLPSHLERVLIRLSSLRASGSLSANWESLLDRVAAELDQARATSRGIRGPAREQLLARLASLDAELLATARSEVDEAALAVMRKEAESDLTTFRQAMTPDVFARTLEAALDRAVRERFRLPTLTFD